MFLKLVRKGIEEGVYIYQREGLVAGQGDPMPAIHIDEQGTLFTMDFAKNKGVWPRQQAVQTSGPMIATSGPGGAIPAKIGDGGGFRQDNGILADRRIRRTGSVAACRQLAHFQGGRRAERGSSSGL